VTYNPIIHHRRSIRLKGYDYSKAGLYFITICVQDRKCLFGKIVGAGLAPAQNDKDAQKYVDVQMELNEFGKIAYNQWAKLPDRFSNFELDVFQIMPNHMHGIVLLNEPVGATLAVAQNETVERDVDWAGASPAPTTVGDMVGAYKSLVVNDCLEQCKLIRPNEILGKLWQRNYYEHIIQNEKSYQQITDYIINNPSNWKDDKFYNPSNN